MYLVIKSIAAVAPPAVRSLFMCVCLLVSGFVHGADDSQLIELKSGYQRPSTIPFPADNPYSADKAVLGKMLFFDQRLSRHFNMNCATCHTPSLGWEDGVATAFGDMGAKLDRHSPTILNLAWERLLFWDGRADSLEEQLRGPIESPKEMNLPLPMAVERLKKVAGYRRQFAKVFTDGITGENILKSIATYERTLVSGTAPFDRWVDGDESAISDEAKEGFRLFNTKARCSQCHGGWNFADQQFYDIGLVTEDMGRKTVSGKESDLHAFKTPGLRNISHRAPYMHNGSLATLEQVIVHYASGGIPRSSRSDKIVPIPLTGQEIQQLNAFLLSLTGEDKPVSLPILPQ